jgi:hypothetical protein
VALGLGCFLLAEWERPQSGLLVIAVRHEADYSEPAGPLASLGRSPATRPPLRLSRLVPPACAPGGRALVHAELSGPALGIVPRSSGVSSPR